MSYDQSFIDIFHVIYPYVRYDVSLKVIVSWSEEIIPSFRSSFFVAPFQVEKIVKPFFFFDGSSYN